MGVLSFVVISPTSCSQNASVPNAALNRAGYCYHYPTMQSTLINLLAGALSSISLPMNHRIGAAIGWFAWTARTNLRTISLVNLSLCFPEWTDEQKNEVAKASLIETGKALTESFWLWKRPNKDVLDRLHITEGEDLLRAAQASPQGLIVATPHLGSWECCCLPLVTDDLVTCLYKPPRMAAIEPIIIEGRKNMGTHITPLDPAGIKHVLTKLKQGSIVGILPDQEPDENNGQFAPFFSHTANTMTLLAKFAKKTNSQVLFCYANRLPKGAGWQVHYMKPTEGVDSTDKVTATRALNRSVEQCILACPEQYMWNYKRFRIRSDGSRRNYKVVP